jgi:hypothetical protein
MAGEFIWGVSLIADRAGIWSPVIDWEPETARSFLDDHRLWRSTKLTRLCSVKLTQPQYSRGKLFFFPSSVVLSR